MKVLFAVAALFVLVASPVARADDGRVHQSTLASLGLGDLQSMSDSEGAEVRGRITTSSFAIGTSFFNFLITLPNGNTLTPQNAPGGPFPTVSMDMQSGMNEPVSVTTSVGTVKL